MLLEKRHTYKPFVYPWCYEVWNKHERMHWMPHEVPLGDDVVDWSKHLTPSQKEFLTQLFRFFTQADVSVADGYASKFLPMFSGHPEVTMMLLSFGAREAGHIAAYALLIETVGMPESEYSAFLDYKAMKDKYDYISEINTDSKVDIAKALAVYSAFTEGMQLFSSFAMLMHFERLGRMKGMTNIVRWSLRDEGIHAESMIQIFRTFCSEYMTSADMEVISHEVRKIAEKMVELEDKFIDLAFAQVGQDLNLGLPPSEKPLTKDELHLYIRHVTDYRLKELGFQPIYGEPENPIPWLDRLLLAPEHTNFFEGKPTEYAKGGLQGEIDYGD